jgi:carnitine-CoA ligase
VNANVLQPNSFRAGVDVAPRNPVRCPGRYQRRSPVAELIRAETAHPDRLLLRWDEKDCSVGEFATLARRCAADLRDRLGIGPQERVVLIGRNSVLRLAWQYGVYWIGAVEVSVNFELKGPMLAHVLTDSRPAIILVDEDLIGEVATHAGSVRLESLAEPMVTADAIDPAALDELEAAIAAEDLATILYTSGTTGPSKGVMLPRAYFANHADSIRETLVLREGDVGYFVLPFFHVDAHIVFPAVIASGSALAFNQRFSVRRFWSEAETFGCTWAFVIGSVLSAVATASHPAKETIAFSRFLGAPIPDDAYEFFEDILGIPILSMYGQTEADGPTFERFDLRKRGSAGIACDAFEIAILDAAGHRLPTGQVGEICHRPRYPNMVMLGYWNRPEATVESWKNLWFHTGDLGRIDDDGFLFYCGRLTDSLRHRGENISAYELEAVLRNAPGVVDVAAVGVVDDIGGEDEIKVLVSCDQDVVLDADEFFDYCSKNLPRYALPRYVEQVEPHAFVRSVGTGVIQKHRLSRAVTGAGVIDRLALDATRAPYPTRENDE